jgi:hypothetical protein
LSQPLSNGDVYMKLATPTCTVRPKRLTTSGLPLSPLQTVFDGVPAPIISGSSQLSSTSRGLKMLSIWSSLTRFVLATRRSGPGTDWPADVLPAPMIVAGVPAA